MSPAPADRCRVLELGCGDGGNLIPMALTLPESTFAGIDLAERAVEQGRAVVHVLGLRNITLRQLDVMQASGLGEFDYILAHGIYSWVPPEVRDRLLSICSANLAPQGIAYVSYNTYPGFHRREMFREMMLYGVQGMEEPLERVREAASFVQSIANDVPQDGLTRALFDEELRHLAEGEPWHVFHDDLAAINYAPYFYEFIAQAQLHRLQYLGEADFHEMQDDIYPESVIDQLRRFAGSNFVFKEQYQDFIKGRRFRQTLLCREEVTVDRRIRPEQITSYYVASQARPVLAGDGSLEEFRGPHGASMKTDYPPAKAALLRLGDVWPQTIRFSELLAIAGGDAAPLAEILFHGYRTGLLELYSAPPQFAASAGDRPLASPLARWHAQRGALVANLRHTTVELEDIVDRYLLLALDGRCGRASLIGNLREFLHSRGEPADSITAEALEVRLERLAKQALLLR
ncbi:MAG: Methyltransferase type 12 [Bryobacterales bacterium]|nr:Methyltransferase type 12 [Bryobacterales bacterium]